VAKEAKEAKRAQEEAKKRAEAEAKKSAGSKKAKAEAEKKAKAEAKKAAEAKRAAEAKKAGKASPKGPGVFGTLYFALGCAVAFYTNPKESEWPGFAKFWETKDVSLLGLDAKVADYSELLDRVDKGEASEEEKAGIPAKVWAARYGMPQAEKANGRAAMIGFAAMYLGDLLFHSGSVAAVNSFAGRTLLVVTCIGVLAVRKTEDIAKWKAWYEGGMDITQLAKGNGPAPPKK